MTIDNVQDITPTVQYVATAGQTSFPYPFPIASAADISVIVNGTPTSAYSVTGVGNDTGGTVVLNSFSAANDIVTIYRDIGISRAAQFSQNGPFLSSAFNAEFNRVYMIMQQLQNQLNRTIHGPFDEVTAYPSLPEPALRKGTNLIFDPVTGLPGVGAFLTTPFTQSLWDGYASTSASLPTLVGLGRTAGEIAAAVTPVNYLMAPGNPLRYQANTAPGTTDMLVGFQNALLANARVVVPAGTYKVSATLNLSAGQIVTGESQKAQINFTNPNASGFSGSGVSGAAVTNLKITVVGTGTSTYIGVVMFTNGSTACQAKNLDISGYSGCGIFVQDSSKCVIRNNYVHDGNITSNNQDQSDIYLGIGSTVGTRYCVVDGNICAGNGTWNGIMILTGAGAISAVSNEYNQITNNRITGTHAAYGIADYNGNKHSDLFNQISGNYIENIQGTVLGGSSGMGIYCVAGGGNTISGNTIINCCVQTTNASLSPGGIGINDSQSITPHTITGNVVSGMTNYHGIQISSCPNGAIVSGNSVEIVAGNGTGNGICVNNSSNTVVTGNNVNNLAANAAILVTGPLTVNNNSVLNNMVRSAGPGVVVGPSSGSPVFQKTIVNNNSVNVSVGSTAINLSSVSQGSLSGNVATTQATTCVALSNCTQLRVAANYFTCNSTFALVLSGACTDTLIDESNFLAGTSNSYMNAVTDTSAGAVALVSQYGAAVPTAGAHTVGSRVIQSASVIGNPKGWRCTTGGTPGTWTSEGNL